MNSTIAGWLRLWKAGIAEAVWCWPRDRTAWVIIWRWSFIHVLQNWSHSRISRGYLKEPMSNLQTWQRWSPETRSTSDSPGRVPFRSMERPYWMLQNTVQSCSTDFRKKDCGLSLLMPAVLSLAWIFVVQIAVIGFCYRQVPERPYSKNSYS